MANSEEQLELKTLIQKRGQLKASLTRFSNYIQKFDENKDITELQARLDAIQSIRIDFENLQSKIELILDSEVDEDTRSSFEDQFFKAISDAQKIISHDNLPSNLNVNASTQNDFSNLSLNDNSLHSKNAKLPILDLPKFYGDYTKWIQFRDNFTSLVHTDKSLSNVTKFHYLNSCLKGDAEQALNSIDVTDDNYEAAWQLLRDRFEDKKIIKANHLKALIEWPHIREQSHVHLRKLLEGLQLHLRALKSLNEPTDSWDSIIIYIFSNKLDTISNREWKIFSENIDSPNVSDFKTFLTKRCRLLESLKESETPVRHTIENKFQTSNFKKFHNRSTSHVVSFNNIQCYLCKDSHYIYKCPALLKLSIKCRLEEIKKLKLCTNCLRNTHTSETCTSGGCKHCGRKHNTILHFDETASKQNKHSHDEGQVSFNACSDSVTKNVISKHSSTSINTHCSQSDFKERLEVLLSTALVNIKDKHGNLHECRVLLDSGSQSNFIRKDICDILHLNKHPINIPVVGINQNVTNISHRTSATIHSKFNAFTMTLSFLVLDQITEKLPLSRINVNKIQIPKNIVLADPTYHTPNKVDMLIGASVFFELLSIGQIKLGTQQPVLQKTKLGWIISGDVPSLSYSPKNVTNHSQVTFCNFSANIEQQLEKFWHLEDIEQCPKHSKEEEECEEHFLKTTTRNDDGHFVVELPVRENINEIGDMYQSALKRFHLLEKRFAKNDDLKRQYSDFIKEYQDLGHMSLVNSSHHSDKTLYYLPHHGVYKETSTTTKLRVVFDGSAQSESGISLNDKLKVGPTVQEDLFSILLRFRKHNFVLVADVEKMYRQVFVHERQRDLQRILWRSNPSQPIQHYQLNTVTYGTASASFLATRSLCQAGIDSQSSHPEASKAILRDFYVDDLLTGTSSAEEANQLMQDLIKVLNSYGFPLRKWISNNKNVLKGTTENTGSASSHFICDDKVTKTLGLLWNSELDIFQYTVNNDTKQNRVTKRIILSTVSKIFDPLGLLGPVVIKAKIILQKLWQLKLNWDEAIPANLHTIWFQFYNQIQRLNDIEIPRHVICFKPTVIQLHSFSDASEQAYGTCIYIRSTDSSNNHFVRLLAAKSRVAPLKNITLPRLELCGALLSVQLTEKVMQSIDMKIDQIYHWCDSTITISWITAESNTWKTFVANRVAEIQRLSNKSQWRHVSSSDNPADIISRGTNPDKLAELKLWWSGPQWLSENEVSWPNNVVQTIDIPEKRKHLVTLTVQHVDQGIFHKFSTLTKLQRVVAWCLRFANNSISSKFKHFGPLTSSELNASLTSLLKLVQASEFAQDIHSLNKSNSVSPKSKLASLNPFLDDNGLIRVGGRLKNSNLAYNIKHPIVLPTHHPFTKLIVLHEHFRHLHAGCQATLCAIRINYWPLNGRILVRGVIRRCVTCFKANPSNTHHQMGQLPSTRTEPCRPFSIVGIDFAGPFDIKDGKCRNRKIVKCYMCIFICFMTKAIHLELVGDLSSDSFLNALKRLISRRGLCKIIYSDNGTNFTGANNYLKNLSKLLSNLDKTPKFREFVNQNNITWNFIPPRSPHFGGIWEAAVKSAKYHLKRILGNAHLTFEEFYTVLTQVEAVLNSRPLTPLSNDPNDFISLTPGHFLIGEPLTAIPQEDVKDIPTNRLTHYKRLQQLIQHFWARWSREYLTSLHQRTKWKLQQPNGVALGSMVLLRDENTPPLHWRVGRICEVFPGEDGIIRVVNVKTTSGIVKRAVSKISVLPIEA